MLNIEIVPFFASSFRTGAMCLKAGWKEGANKKEWLNDIMNFEISPILNEYWFDNKDKAESLIENLNS